MVMKLGVDVALHHLGGDGGGAQAQFPADISLDPRRQVRAGAHRAGDFAHRRDLPRPLQPRQGAPELIVHQRELEAEGGRLGMNAVAAADAGGELMLLRAPRDARPNRPHIRHQQVRALRHLHGVGGVAHVAAGQAKVEPAAGGVVDSLSHGGGEADDVMVEDFLQLLLPRDQAGEVGEPTVTAGLDLREVLGRHHPFLHQRLAGQELDSQPEPELVFIRPDGPHFWTRVTLNHGDRIADGPARVEPGISEGPPAGANREINPCFRRTQRLRKFHGTRPDAAAAL